jgi:hypothetical protein
MIPAASEAWDVKLGRRLTLTARQQRETIKRRDAGEPVREIALSPLMERITCNPTYFGGIEIIIGTCRPLVQRNGWRTNLGIAKQCLAPFIG